VDQLDGFLLSQSTEPLGGRRRDCLAGWIDELGLKGAYHKRLLRDVRLAGREEASPQHLLGQTASDEFLIRENGVQYAIRFGEGYSIGLFLDQRDNRRRLLKQHVAAGFPLDIPSGAEALNLFAYTCGFSVCAALAGMRVTSLDLSEKYLEWGRKNFLLNSLDPATHAFLCGDAFDWLRRLRKKGERYALILLDPPTFSQSKKSGRFQAEKDYNRLIMEALPLLQPQGVLFASTNAARLPPEKFMAEIEPVFAAARRTILQKHYFPQPPDFPIHRDEPDYLKTVWYRVG
jgi:23S rRNA (cytosine1962-C5)-methyltransferase